MAARTVIPAYRLFFALLTLAAIITQAVSLTRLGVFDPVNYFSFFTIDSNLIATVLLVVGAARWNSTPSPVMDLLRGAGVVYMTVTGVVFTLLLSGVDVDTQLAWVNTVVHELMPIVILADWFIAPPVARLTMRTGSLWLAFPLVWIVYTLIRGAVSGKYPYPFLNPANGAMAAWPCTAWRSSPSCCCSARSLRGLADLGPLLGSPRSRLERLALLGPLATDTRDLRAAFTCRAHAPANLRGVSSTTRENTMYRALRPLWGLIAVGAATAVGVTTRDAGFTVITFIGALVLPRVLGLAGPGWRHHGRGWSGACAGRQARTDASDGPVQQAI